MRRLLLFLAAWTGFAAVAPAQITPPTAPPALPAAPADWLLRELDNSPILRQHHAGLQLTDVASGEVLAAWHADKYFTPASTQKMLTLYAALRILPDSVPALRYVVRGDTLLFRGTADPTFLHGDVPSTRAYQLLRRWPGPVAYTETPMADAKLGPGWSWDDYPYYFQPERGPFPIYGHTVRFYYRRPGQSAVAVRPAWFKASTQKAPTGATSPDHVRRELEANRYTWFPTPRAWVDEVPFRTDHTLLLTLLRDTLKREVQPAPWRLRPGETARTYYGLNVDSLLRRCIRVSDNFLAEQTLLLCSAQLGHDTLSIARTMKHVRQQGWLRPLPDSVAWVDGSGLSRQNLTTPRNQVALLLELHKLVPEARLFDLLAAGGRQGTLKRAYRDPKGLWFWGKTGTLTNNHNLCGYLRTRSGRLLAVSFMNNNHLAETSVIRREMERVLTLVREQL
ncbi:D-alanyl-D-alanine carboxypeptidase/D-alanyl-D-alanine-endopeptidase [Hymenobacter jeollabukensis]|uniref:Peptidase S13 n=1 Tax=Hymenobacter jeollabukensis TaxID=2025313 RepID=A0A5R8WMA8_9BACT|nr:D-alanyl-D-alanine carboxypeptidase [Hymenobacter jeollabukensis]TLM90027.1 peptidase S13 [Hymenobacter jeollabukensis]